MRPFGRALIPLLPLVVLATALLAAGHHARAASGLGSLPSGASTPASQVCGQWSVYASPNPTTTGYLLDVSAVSTTDVWAAGIRFDPGQNNRPLTLRWNGSQWLDIPSPTTPDFDTELFAVEAVASNQAWAAGIQWDSTMSGNMFMMRWNGTQWSIIPDLPLANVGRLFGLGASSPNDAWAAGEYRGGIGTRPLILHWDGEVWNAVPVPYPGGARSGRPSGLHDRDGAVLWDGDTQLFGVQAISPNDAWAVGYHISEGQRRVLTLHWNGIQWSIVPNPGIGYLWGLSALSANNVWAAGVTGSYPTYRLLVMHWDGAQWSVVKTPDVLLGSYEWQLADVAAVADDDVWAVSSQETGQSTQAVMLHWDGSTWSHDPGPGPQPYGSNLSAVEAVSGGDIWSVGFGPTTYRYTDPCLTPTSTPSPTVTQIPTSTRTFTRTGTPTRTRTPTATGTPQCLPNWAVVPSGSIAGSELHAVEVVSEDDIWAVGSTPGSGNTVDTLTMHWNGTTWNVVSSPSPMQQNVLRGVTAVSPDDAWAVGHSTEIGTNLFWTLILHWDGAQWTTMPPVLGGLLAVDARASNDVWAVGNPVMHWDGTRWRVVPTPDFPVYFLTGVAAIAANNAWAVGFHGSPGASQMLIEHWDGTQWSIVPAPPTGAEFSELRAISALSASDIWAAGSARNSGSATRALTIHWDGTQWMVVASPSVGVNYDNIWGLDAHSPNNVWAVGHTSEDLPLIMHWNGTAWNPQSVPDQGGLNGVAAFSPTDLWAVGSRVGDSLVLRYTQRCPTGTATVTSTTTSTSVPATPTSTRTATPTRTQSRTPTRTVTATYTSTPVPPSATATSCSIAFSDVHPTDYFYEAVRHLFCAGVISGYADNTFRPFNNTTRGQLTKIVVLAEGWPLLDPLTPTFSDVPTNHAFYRYVETAYDREIISGYADGTFRPGNNVTRGQLCKIVVLAEGWELNTAGGPHFSDVPPAHTFYLYVETAFNRQIISGYAGGTFRPGNPATRGQICKVIYNALASP